jgi:SAM-dependent methyltransferase
MDTNKAFYTAHADDIWDKRIRSQEPIRAYAHAQQNEVIATHVVPGETVLDAGCGQGVLALLLAARGFQVTGMDISVPNIERANMEAAAQGLADKVTFLQGDAEQLPFPDKSFDVVVSSHVLEHVPNFDKGFAELCRVARRRVVVALPTGLNLCASALLGGDYGYWRLSKRSVFAIPWGIVRTIANFLTEGVQEGYAGKDELPHVWRYPWVVYRRLKNPAWRVVSYEASTLCLPYFTALLPLVKWLDRHRAAPVLRYFGYGSTVTLEPRH